VVRAADSDIAEDAIKDFISKQVLSHAALLMVFERYKPGSFF
jgi:hypothetical protein